MPQKVRFARVLRVAGMSYGVAVDKSGRHWRGFFSNRTPQQVWQDAQLASVGLCAVCGDRVYEGWECAREGIDLCPRCVRLPRRSKVRVVAEATEEEWQQLTREFVENARPDQPGRHSSSG